MKKYVLLIVTVLILCGCSNEYNLTIENDKFTESINVVIPKDSIHEYTQAQADAGIERDDQITPFLENEHYALKDKKYNKKVTEDDNNYYINLSYEYTPEEFKDGQAISGCFENVTYEVEDDYYLINLSGQFFCLYGDELVINVNTSNTVEEHNANSISGNEYIWKINNDNVRNTNISIKVLKNNNLEKYVMIGVIVGVIIAVVVIALSVSKIISNKEKLNEI